MTTVMKLSDYVMQCVARAGVRHVFMVPGGGAMHLNDRSGGAPTSNSSCTLHEQAAAIAAEAYAKVTNDLGVAHGHAPGRAARMPSLASRRPGSIRCPAWSSPDRSSVQT